jgi:hypothetical protein
MKYRIQIFYQVADCFMNTNHESDSLDALKDLARSEIFLGCRIRIVDGADKLIFAPPVRERKGDPTVSDIAAMLDVPIIEPPNGFFDEKEDDEV